MTTLRVPNCTHTHANDNDEKLPVSQRLLVIFGCSVLAWGLVILVAAWFFAEITRLTAGVAS